MRDGTTAGTEEGIIPVDTIRNRSSGRAPIRVAVTVTGLGTTGERHETQPRVSVQAVGVTEGEQAVGLTDDEMSGGLTLASSRWNNSRGHGAGTTVADNSRLVSTVKVASRK